MDKKFWIQIIALMLVIFIGMSLSINSSILDSILGNVSVNTRTEKSQVVIKGTSEVKIDVEVADTKAKRSQGLGGRESLAKDQGMLFIFDVPKKHQFWMKGLSFPLDFIWIRDNTIVDLLPNIAPPISGQADETLPILEPIVEVDKVLEVNAGFIEEKKIKVGDKVEIIR